MDSKFFVVNQEPEKWANTRQECHSVVTMAPWQRTSIFLADLTIKGRQAWLAPQPIWRNELIYYNLTTASLVLILNRIVVHHTNNSNSILENEKSQQQRGYAALGYHFFINKKGIIYEGRPLEIMGSHAGQSKKAGPLNDPDWGSVGIALQGDYHHDDDWIINSESTQKQLNALERLTLALKKKYLISRLLMHKEIIRSGKPTVCPGDHLAKHVIKIRNKLSMLGKG